MRPPSSAASSASAVRNGPPTAVTTVVTKAELATSYSVKPETARRREAAVGSVLEVTRAPVGRGSGALVRTVCRRARPAHHGPSRCARSDQCWSGAPAHVDWPRLQLHLFARVHQRPRTCRSRAFLRLRQLNQGPRTVRAPKS